MFVYKDFFLVCLHLNANLETKYCEVNMYYIKEDVFKCHLYIGKFLKRVQIEWSLKSCLFLIYIYSVCLFVYIFISVISICIFCTFWIFFTFLEFLDYLYFLYIMDFFCTFLYFFYFLEFLVFWFFELFWTFWLYSLSQSFWDYWWEGSSLLHHDYSHDTSWHLPKVIFSLPLGKNLWWGDQSLSLYHSC